MRVNRRGLVSLVDAMLFLLIVSLALSVPLYLDAGGDPVDADPSTMLDDLCGARMRMSDLYPGGDGSLLPLTDMLAMDVVTGTDAALSYAGSYLDEVTGVSPYRLTLGYGDLSVVIGDEVPEPVSGASAEVPVTAGGRLRMTLVIG
ncbi:MAG: hypothetical protein IJ026_03685 [Candidatus Methanomethylophilaceae archaeon]|nr:hypothetical protein [Candidatus Methanomethylophilaceae archaeon]